MHTTGGHGSTTTQATGAEIRSADTPSVPGLVVIFANRRPRSRVFRSDAAPLELGRLELAEDDVLDTMISRKHVRFRLEPGGFEVEDLGSRNGTTVGGKPATGQARAAFGEVVRVGGCLLVPVPDVLRFQRSPVGVYEGTVASPAFKDALEAVELSRRTGMVQSLLVTGESGTGKEIAARAFHGAGRPSSPLVAVNCATIPKEIAERLLFGSKRGAFSGATDAPGHVQAASGGTLFLDEVAELSLEVQTKLLRMLETREVLRLGSTSPEHVDVHVCAATWRDLRAEVAAGRFRQDLYFRIGQPEIRLPPLRARVEEIPWHVQQVLDESASGRITASALFLEACSLRAWPGNVRELRAEVKRAIASIQVRDRDVLNAEDLAPRAGEPIGPPPQSGVQFPDDEVARALAAEQGNVLAAARRLGMHRNKVRRWLERYAVDARHFRTDSRRR